MDRAETDLEEQLTRLTGAARVAPLLRLAQLRSNRYVRLPTGSAAAGAVLEPAIANLREASGLLPPDDPGRPQVDNALGWLLSMRYSGHGGSTTDRDTAIDLLSGSVETAKLAPVQQQAAFLILGQLSALRALQMDPNGTADPMRMSMGWMTGGLSARAREDLDRAHDYLNRVVAAGPVNEQVRQAAEAMLQMVTMMREMFGGMGGGNLMQNFTHLTGMMSRMGGMSAPAARGPLWTPAVGVPTIVEGTVIPRQARPVETDGLTDLRRDLLRRLASHVGAAPSVPDVVPAVLRPDTPPMPWADADEAVATATALREGGSEGGSVASDGLLLAVALWLRARADDGGGWEDDPGATAAADRLAGLTALADAVSALPPDDPAAEAARDRAIAFLPDAPPLRGIPDDLAGRFVDGGAGREVFRSGLALRAGRPVDAGAVEKAAAAADGPWRTRTRTALGVALLAAPATARRGLALLDGDPDLAALVRTLLDGPDAEVASHAAGTGTAPADAFATAVHGTRRYLLRRLAGCPVTVAVPDGVDALVVTHPRGELVLDRDGTVRVADGGLPAGRVVVIAPGDLGTRPWAIGAPDGAVVWTAGSLDRLLRATGPLRDVDADAVFVANPAGDRDLATLEAMTLRRMLYPVSTGLGRTVEQVAGPGTPDEVLAHLPGPAGPGASMLHLGCAVRTAAPAALVLASGDLDLERVAGDGTGGGLVVLPADAATDPAGLLAVADTLLDAGMSGAVHWLRPVPPAVATLMLYRLHEYLVDDRMSPPDAVAAVHRWMRDPDRLPPRCVPAGHRTDHDLTDPALWGALAFRV